VTSAAESLIRPFTPRALGAALYGLLALPLALAGMLLTSAGLAVSAVLSVTPLGPWLLAGTLRGALALGALHRWLVRVLVGDRVEAPALRKGRGLFGRRRAMLGDRAAWRAVGWLFLTPVTAVPPLLVAVMSYVYGPLFFTYPLLRFVNYRTVTGSHGEHRHVGFPLPVVNQDTVLLQLLVPLFGLALLVAGPWLVERGLQPQRAVLEELLGRDSALDRIRTLEETRAQALDDAVTTLRRIERDLHDGTQARLVGLGMQLTMARELVAGGADRQRVLSVVDSAREGAKQAVADLRDLVRGIHPPVLDAGLEVALSTLAAGCALPVGVTVTEGERRPSAAVESIAYFCAAELLANAVKHGRAGAASVQVRCGEGVLRLRVSDDGYGGARIGAGSGLTGLLDRVRTVDGTLDVHSPPGGPTVVTVDLPY